MDWKRRIEISRWWHPINFKALTPTVIKVGLISFFADIASEMLYPITPIFLTTVLGASMASVGLIEGTAEATASLLRTYSGALSDRVGRRAPFIWTGYLLSALSRPFVGGATSWFEVLAARALERVGKGLRTAPRDALLAEAVPAQLRGAAFGWHRGIDTLGAVVGPLLTIGFISYNPQPEQLRSLFYWALIPGFVAVAIAFRLKDPATVSSHQTIGRTRPPKGWATRNFKIYLGGWMIFSLANSSDAFLLLKARSSGLSLVHVILMYCSFNFIYAIFSPWLGSLSDRIARRNLLCVGLGLFALVYLGFAMAQEVWHYWALFPLYGLYMAGTEGIGKALAVDLVPASVKATGLGVLGTVTGFSSLFASIVAGILWDQWGAAATFAFGAAGATVAMFVITQIRLRPMSQLTKDH